MDIRFVLRTFAIRLYIARLPLSHYDDIDRASWSAVIPNHAINCRVGVDPS